MARPPFVSDQRGGADPLELTPINSTALWPMSERPKIRAVQFKEINHKPPSLAPSTPAALTPPTPTHIKLPTHSITPLSCPTPKAVTHIPKKLGDSTRCSSRLCAEISFQRTCVNIHGAPKLQNLEPRAHPAANLLLYFRDHGNPVTTAKSMKSELLHAALCHS